MSAWLIFPLRIHSRYVLLHLQLLCDLPMISPSSQYNDPDALPCSSAAATSIKPFFRLKENRLDEKHRGINVTCLSFLCGRVFEPPLHSWRKKWFCVLDVYVRFIGYKLEFPDYDSITYLHAKLCNKLEPILQRKLAKISPLCGGDRRYVGGQNNASPY